MAGQNECHIPRRSMRATCPHIYYKKCFTIEYPESEGEHRPGSEIFADIAFRNEACGDCGMRRHLSGYGAYKSKRHPWLVGFFLLPITSFHQWTTRMTDEKCSSPSTRRLLLKCCYGHKRELNVRQWVMQLLQRYGYVIGNVSSLFERISSPQGAAQVVARTERMPNAALLCINDNAAKESLTTQLTQELETWFDKRWKTLSAWEQR